MFYFYAETEAKAEKGYKSLAKQLEVEEENEDDCISRVNNKLTKLAKTNEIIFIFDNLEDYSFIEKYICNRPESIRVLTTVRNKETISDERFLHIQLVPFSRDEATDYVVKILGEKKIKREQINELVAIVGDSNEVIPFNLNKGVSILSKPSIKTVEEHLKNIKNNPKLWLQTKFYDVFMKNETTAKIMELIPYFDPDSINIKLLALVIGFDKATNSMEDSFDNALDELLKNFLIKQNEDGEQISVHRLLQKELSEYFKNSENKQRTRETFIRIIDENFPNVERTDKTLYDVYNTHMHAISLAEKKIIEGNIEDVVQTNNAKISIFNKLGSYYERVQKYNFALRYTKIASEMIQILGDHESKSCIYNNIGNIYKSMGDFKNSLEFLNKALEIDERLFQGDNEKKAIVYSNMGDLYRNMGEYKKSIVFHEKSLKMRQSLCQEDNEKYYYYY